MIETDIIRDHAANTPTDKVITILSVLGVLHWVGPLGVMKTFIGDRVVYPLMILSVVFVLASLLFRKYDRSLTRFAVASALIAILVYLCVWSSIHIFGFNLQ